MSRTWLSTSERGTPQVKANGFNVAWFLLSIALYVLGIVLEVQFRTEPDSDDKNKPTPSAVVDSPSDKVTDGPRPISLEALERFLDDFDLDQSPGFQPTPSSPDR